MLVNYKFKDGSESLSSHTGLALVGALLERTDLKGRLYSKIVTDAAILVRLDSGNDSLDNIRVCIKEGVGWIIKRNLRKECKNKWLEIAKDVGEATNKVAI